MVKSYVENDHTVIKFLGVKLKFKLNKPSKCSYYALQQKYNDLSNEYQNLSNEYQNYCETNQYLIDLANKFPILNELNKEPNKFSLNYGVDIATSLCHYISSRDFGVKLNNLTQNIDNQSLLVINDFIQQLIFIRIMNAPNLATKEQISCYKNLEHIKNSIVQHNGNYCINNILFSTMEFDLSVIASEVGIAEIENKEYFKEKDIIDLGAYIGDSSFPMCKYTNKKIYAFEPVEDSFRKLEKHVVLNNAQGKVLPIKYAASDKNEELEIFYGSYKTAATTNKDILVMDKNDKLKSEIIKTTILDEFVQKNNINVGLIKFDIEGAELFAIKGALNTIREKKPTLLISIYHEVSDFFEIKSYIESLNLGYKFKIRKFNAQAFFYDIVLICEVESNGNI